MIKEIIRELVGYNDLLKDYNKIYDRLLYYEDNINNLEKELKSLTKKIIETETKYEESKKIIKELLTKKQLKINDLKKWYENRRIQTPWTYNGVRLGIQDVTKYLQVKDLKEFTKIAKEIIKEYELSIDSNPTEIVTSCYKYWNKKNSWYYFTDKQLYDKTEFWEEASSTIINRRGDCETKSMCMYWTIDETLRLLDYSEHDWRLTFVASIVVGEGGHAYLTWLHDDGEYYVIESTFYEDSSYNKTWLRTPMRFNNLYQEPWGFANKYRSWRGSCNALISFSEDGGK